jgi:hypothetical protein
VSYAHYERYARVAARDPEEKPVFFRENGFLEREPVPLQGTAKRNPFSSEKTGF